MSIATAATTPPSPVQADQTDPTLFVLVGVGLTLLVVTGVIRIVVNLVAAVATVIESIAKFVFAVGATTFGLGVIGAAAFVYYVFTSAQSGSN